VVSFLPGRTLTKAQALSAIQIADSAAAAAKLASHIGLTTLEAVGLAPIILSFARSYDYSTGFGSKQ